MTGSLAVCLCTPVCFQPVYVQPDGGNVEIGACCRPGFCWNKGELLSGANGIGSERWCNWSGMVFVPGCWGGAAHLCCRASPPFARHNSSCWSMGWNLGADQLYNSSSSLIALASEM